MQRVVTRQTTVRVIGRISKHVSGREIRHGGVHSDGELLCSKTRLTRRHLSAIRYLRSSSLASSSPSSFSECSSSSSSSIHAEEPPSFLVLSSRWERGGGSGCVYGGQQLISRGNATWSQGLPAMQEEGKENGAVSGSAKQTGGSGSGSGRGGKISKGIAATIGLAGVVMGGAGIMAVLRELGKGELRGEEKGGGGGEGGQRNESKLGPDSDVKVGSEGDSSPESTTTVVNWSGTHEVRTRDLFQPETEEEVIALVAEAHANKRKIRAVGSALSPNGIALCEEGMLNMALCDRVINVDKEKMTVTVQAGARVDQVVEALREHGLTLQNYASIKEQQIGGFTQVGAHGTGATLPPVDEQVIRMKLVTPARGVLELSMDKDPELFKLARCGLGALGVVTEVTLQCVPAHQLVEYTFASNAKEIKKKHKEWIRNNRHLRYMWIPYTDTVVVVQCNPVAPEKQKATWWSWFTRSPQQQQQSNLSLDERLAHVRALYKEVSSTSPPPSSPSPLSSPSSSTSPSSPSLPSSSSSSSAAAAVVAEELAAESSTPVLPATSPSTAGDASAGPRSGHAGVREEEEVNIQCLSFTELRDKLLAVNPFDPDHVARVNQAEAEFWRKSAGYRAGWSDQILGFECGGQQWVSEVAFPIATLSSPNMKDIAFMEELMAMIKTERIAAPAPIEQRWTAVSSSPMSPASPQSLTSSPTSSSRNQNADSVFSWVGIIMYLPSDDPEVRRKITERFLDYRKRSAQQLWDKYQAFEHWAKIEVPETDAERRELADRLRKRFPVDAFNQARRDLDPHNILSNDVIDALFPLHSQ
ncbi:hypothetical protein CBR_g48422 [Chara braunii]|uniref:FAD-binding PCMH-type domain-containing protein n=1 Tax=Chara braunii TaxID=69332 RepID=A0A388M2K4_CHABU|nr:hypothetical protein CBR_g48422 [Chara braunii]|eukprot:GBG88807.1 hypothetical protein CBR_g48422 [Chara braunii]